MPLATDDRVDLPPAQVKRDTIVRPAPLTCAKACFHASCMTMIQIRNVPAATHRKLKARAALEGVSMSQFVLRQIEKSLETSSRQELLARIRELPEPQLDETPADVLRRAREER